jgi:hypothetical protein
MKVEIKDTEGVLLEYLVALCEGWKPVYVNNVLMLQHYHPDASHTPKCYPEDFDYTKDWQCGGPIIERSCISLDYAQQDDWAAKSPAYQWAYGTTPLIAAMRCYVASKLGEEVEIPDELL